MDDDPEYQSEGLDYQSFRLLAKFHSFTDQAEKGKVTCPGPLDWLVRAKTSMHVFWPPNEWPFHPSHCPQRCGRMQLTSVARLWPQRGKVSCKLRKLLLVFFRNMISYPSISKKVGLWVIPFQRRVTAKVSTQGLILQLPFPWLPAECLKLQFTCYFFSKALPNITLVGRSSITPAGLCFSLKAFTC